VFTLEGQEGRLFKPLAFTKTFAMAAASLLSVTLVPVTHGTVRPGTLYRERANPVNRLLIWRYRRSSIRAALSAGRLSGRSSPHVVTWLPWKRMGSEFMPPWAKARSSSCQRRCPG
jgi:Cu(I)/Ag(I) efflux system membrane protein CusA/SilA